MNRHIYHRDLLQRVKIIIQSLTIANNFRQGWKDAMTGQTYPVSELWDDIDINE